MIQNICINRGVNKIILPVIFAGILIMAFSYGEIFAADNQAVKYYKYGASLQQKGKYDEAVKYYGYALKQQKNMWQAWLGMGICYYKMKKEKNAALIFEHVLSLKPDEPTAKKYLLAIKASKKEQNIPGEKTLKTKGEMMWRSALLPGFGQFYNNEHAKGYIYSLGFLAAAAGIVKFTIDQNRAVDDYANTNYDFDAYYKKAEDRTKMVWIPVGVAAAVWGMSVIDAYISGADEGKKIRIRAWIDENNSAVAGASYEMRF